MFYYILQYTGQCVLFSLEINSKCINSWEFCPLFFSILDPPMLQISFGLTFCMQANKIKMPVEPNDIQLHCTIALHM